MYQSCIMFVCYSLKHIYVNFCYFIMQRLKKYSNINYMFTGHFFSMVFSSLFLWKISFCVKFQSNLCSGGI